MTLFPESELLDLQGDFTGQIFNAQVTDAHGNPVVDGTSVNFSLDVIEGFVCAYGETGVSIDELYSGSGCPSDSVVISGVARTILSYAGSVRWGTFH